jgi:hypothetical protein
MGSLASASGRRKTGTGRGHTRKRAARASAVPDAATKRRAPEADDDFLSPVDAIGGAEDVGGFDLPDLLWSLAGALAKSGRLVPEA